MSTKIALVKTRDRAAGISRAVGLLADDPEVSGLAGKDVLLKPNFNTADPYPASTHNDTLKHLVATLRELGARGITIGERSGPPKTSDVLKEKGIYGLAKELDVGLINFEELSPEDWVRVKPPGSRWLRGVRVARPVMDAERVVCTCCLKTHKYGGVFTMSLKLSVGITHKGDMAELHSSFMAMRKMIADINHAYTPSLILLDGIDVFTDGGPMSGTLKQADVILAGTDRVAVDAVGLAVLKHLGSNSDVMETPIFKQEQIARAVELGLGVKGPGEIEIVTSDPESESYAEKLREILKEAQAGG